jgi:hypothetical protein
MGTGKRLPGPWQGLGCAKTLSRLRNTAPASLLSLIPCYMARDVATWRTEMFVTCACGIAARSNIPRVRGPNMRRGRLRINRVGSAISERSPFMPQFRTLRHQPSDACEYAARCSGGCRRVFPDQPLGERLADGKTLGAVAKGVAGQVVVMPSQRLLGTPNGVAAEPRPRTIRGGIPRER